MWCKITFSSIRNITLIWNGSWWPVANATSIHTHVSEVYDRWMIQLMNRWQCLALAALCNARMNRLNQLVKWVGVEMEMPLCGSVLHISMCRVAGQIIEISEQEQLGRGVQWKWVEPITDTAGQTDKQWRQQEKCCNRGQLCLTAPFGPLTALSNVWMQLIGPPAQRLDQQWQQKRFDCCALGHVPRQHSWWHSKQHNPRGLLCLDGKSIYLILALSTCMFPSL